MEFMNILDCKINIDPIVPSFTSTAITALKIAIPIILIVMGMLDIAKAVTSNDDKVMKEAQSKLIKRIIYAVVVFFIVAIVQLVFGILGKAGKNSSGANAAGTENNTITGCIDCFINGNHCTNSDGDAINDLNSL